MPKSIRIAKTAIDDAISSFSELPAKAPSDYPLKEAIGQLLPAINDLIKKGYNLSEIAELLAQKNIVIGSTTLKQYLRDFNKSEPTPSPSKQSKQSKPKAIATETIAEKNQETSVSEVDKKITAQVKEAAVEKIVSPEKPYKSPPKPGSEKFK
jgi:hypothetical protein